MLSNTQPGWRPAPADAAGPCTAEHDHVFLGQGHARAERRTRAVIGLSACMMAVEITGGWLTGSVALVADGLHMSTHAGAMLLAALAYRAARRHAGDPRFTFGTGKLGDLAAFASAVLLGGMALLIGAEALGRLFAPVPIHFAQAIPIACLGLAVNAASAALLYGAHHGGHDGHAHGAVHRDDKHGAVYRDNNMWAITLHVTTDAAVTLLVIAGLLLARRFGWLWLDPVAGLAGTAVIAAWSVRLARAAGSILVDMMPDRQVAERIGRIVGAQGDAVTDLHVWRVGPGHLAAIVSVRTASPRDAAFYRPLLLAIPHVSHATVEILPG